MLEGFMDMRGETVERLGGSVTEGDVDVAVDAIMHGAHTTATPALAQLNALTESEDGIRRLCGMMSAWAVRERRKGNGAGEAAGLALDHFRATLNGHGGA